MAQFALAPDHLRPSTVRVDLTTKNVGKCYLYASRSEKDTDYPLDSTIAAKRFVARDFIVSTKTAEIVHVKTSGTRVSKILWEHDAAVNALAACPNK